VQNALMTKCKKTPSHIFHRAQSCVPPRIGGTHH